MPAKPMRRALPSPFAAAALPLLLLAAGLTFSTILPVDETRYVAVAWEMWLRGDFIVPHLNGAEYSQKPPLLFWLLALGWWVFGVNDWWPRIIPAASAAASVLLIAHIARLLWPSRPDVRANAPFIVQAGALWMLFTPAIMFDMPLALFVLVAITGLLHAWRGRWAGWLLCGTGLGLAILTKGPVALLHVVPVALLAPFWMREQRPAWWRWYAGVGIAIVIAAAIALAWAIPAAMRGSDEYATAIFWGQSANRIVRSFAHSHPFWWYLPFIPLILFPWILWKPAWVAVPNLWRDKADSGTRFCVSWSLPAFVIFSSISGKQVHYLLPLVPALGLLIARALASSTRESAIGGGAPKVEIRRAFWSVPKIAVACVSATALLGAFALRTMAPLGHDITPIARHLKALELDAVPVAHLGGYQGQFHFVGRLERPFTALQWGDLGKWVDAHPDGKVLVHVPKKMDQGLNPENLYRYRNHHIAIVDGAAAISLMKQERCCTRDEM